MIRPCEIKELAFPQPLGEIVRGVSQAVEAAGIGFRSMRRQERVFLQNVREQRACLRSNVLGRLYKDWYILPDKDPNADELWNRFINRYKRESAIVRGGVTFDDYQRVVYFPLPTVPDYEGNGVYDIAKVQVNNGLQIDLALALGILGETEEWGDIVDRPNIQLVGNNHQEVATLLKNNSGISPRIDSEGMVELPAVFSHYFDGVAARIRFYSTVKEDKTTPFEQLVRDGKVSIVLDAFISADILSADESIESRRPADRDQFRSDLSRLFSKS